MHKIRLIFSYCKKRKLPEKAEVWDVFRRKGADDYEKIYEQMLDLGDGADSGRRNFLLFLGGEREGLWRYRHTGEKGLQGSQAVCWPVRGRRHLSLEKKTRAEGILRPGF